MSSYPSRPESAKHPKPCCPPCVRAHLYYTFSSPSPHLRHRKSKPSHHHPASTGSSAT
ncbi:hypothetical protein BJV78DRAFT_1225488 [Lactifluus subvellereus]|nr:hypothetical protein BJV78DRAFT_1225488 [Lactifluus subvellereus]